MALVHSVPLRALSVLAAAGLLALSGGGCGGDTTPTTPRAPASLLVTTVAELDDALQHSVAADTIELRSEFSSNEFHMPRGYVIPADRSPLRIVGSARGGQQPVIIFPDSTDGLTFVGHENSTLFDLGFRGGRDALRLENSSMTLRGLTIQGPSRDGVAATGGATNSAVDSCLIEDAGAYGVNVRDGARVLIQRNTIVRAGNSGLYVGANCRVRANILFGSANFGAFFAAAATEPEVTCNDAFGNTGGAYRSEPDGRLDFGGNLALDPKFCAGSFYISEVSPCAPLNSGGCGQIGMFRILCSP